MEIDFKKVKEFIIRVENREEKAKFINIGEEGELIFEIPPDSQIVGTLGKKGEVFFKLEGREYSFSGNIFSPEPQKLVVIKQSEVIPNKRIDDRIETQVLPAKIKEKKLLFEKVIEAYIMDLSRNGAKIETEHLLNQDEEYLIETTLDKRPFSATFKVKSIKERKGKYIYGILFRTMTVEDEKVLERYIEEMNNKPKEDELEKVDLSKLWREI